MIFFILSISSIHLTNISRVLIPYMPLLANLLLYLRPGAQIRARVGSSWPAPQWRLIGARQGRRGRTWEVGWLAPPPIGVKRADWSQASQDTGAAGAWEGLIRAPIGPAGYCSACHSGQLFWSFCLAGRLAFIYMDTLISS